MRATSCIRFTHATGRRNATIPATHLLQHAANDCTAPAETPQQRPVPVGPFTKWQQPTFLLLLLITTAPLAAATSTVAPRLARPLYL